MLEASQLTKRYDTTHGARPPVSVRNATLGRSTSGRRRWTRGVGLTSVERRLACHYGAAASLQIHTDKRGATVVDVTLPASTGVDRIVAHGSAM
jgi:hypothetical protein